MENAKVFFFSLIIVICSSCMTVDYVGKSFQKTDHVDIYYDSFEINQDFEIIGQAVGEGGRTKRVQENLVEKAKEEGADGIVIGGISRLRSMDQTGGTVLHRQITASFIKYKNSL